MPKKWQAPDGSVLVEGEASAADFEGVPLPGVGEAHAYELQDEGGKVVKRFLPEQVRLDVYKECFHLIRYQVEDDVLVKYTSYCYEESTYDIPFAHEPKKTAVLEGLRRI